MVATTHTKGVLQISSQQTSEVVVDIHTAKLRQISEFSKFSGKNFNRGCIDKPKEHRNIDAYV